MSPACYISQVSIPNMLLSWEIVQPHGRSCDLMEDQKGTMQSHGRSSDLIGNHVTKWMDHEAFQNS